MTKEKKARQEGYIWTDLCGPSKEDLAKIEKKYALHPELVKDSMEADHLPKYERMDGYSFIIFRYISTDSQNAVDSLQELTHKVAIFYSDSFVLTIHSKEHKIFSYLKEVAVEGAIKSGSEFVNALIGLALATFDEPVKKLIYKIDSIEKIVFLNQRKESLLESLYQQKRKADLLRRVLILSYDIIDALDPDTIGSVYTRDTRDLYVKYRHMLDALVENIPHLLSIHFSSAAQKTNEIMRVLTIFSVFFMPLSFIAGVYGMNFKFMPELELGFGYPFVLLVMVMVSCAIYIWFKKKDWL